MRKLIAGALAIMLAAPAFAQGGTTLEHVIAKGISLDIGGGNAFLVDYKPDGTWTAADGAVTGKWRIDGEVLCTLSNFDPAEDCVKYPTGKKSGDSFEVTGKNGTGTITIR